MTSPTSSRHLAVTVPLGELPASNGHASANQSVTFARLIAMECRKMVDTRAARWLIVTTVALASVVAVARVRLSFEPELPPTPVMAILSTATMALQLFVPMVAIVAAASEWTQHGATLTYTVEPRRLRVLAAKAVAVVTVTVALYVVMTGICLAAAGVAARLGADLDWEFRITHYAWTGVVLIFWGLSGLALGTLFMNTAGAIFAYLVVPTLLELGAAFSDGFAEVTRWIGGSEAFAPLVSAPATPLKGGYVAATIGFWLLAPIILGAVRTVRREVS